jgi:hypothetical protein
MDERARIWLTLRSVIVKVSRFLRVFALGTAALLMISASANQAYAGTQINLNGSTIVSPSDLSSESSASISDILLANQLSQYGITWFFDKEYPYGQFANGDYWVVGPITITNITPDFDGLHHGWEVNPLFEGPQGFDERAGNFNASLVPNLPYTAQPNESIVKAISYDLEKSECVPCLKTAAVLTVLSEPPPDNGAVIFRPPYVGDDKPFYAITDLQRDLLPSYAPVPNAPTLAWIEDRYKRVQLDHKGGLTGRCLRPVDNMPDYGSNVSRDNGDAALRLMLNDPLETKLPALIVYVQYGIDLYYMVLNGQTWPEGGGHTPGQKLPLTFASVLLDDGGMKEAIQTATFFNEDVAVYSNNDTGVALYGFHDQYWSERQYWSTIETLDGFWSNADPYGYIDAGPEPGGSYQFCCVSQPWKGTALALHLMPVMKTVWYNQAFFDYVDRWVNLGTWTQPDPCAPYDGNPAHYGITYGPDGNGGCILDKDPSDGIGRFPTLHGTNADGGYRYSEFQREMWDAYRDAIEEPTFEDVPVGHWAYEYIERLYQDGYIVGCSITPRLYCPDRILNRAEEAVFVVRGVHGAQFDPLNPSIETFEDVSLADWFFDWTGQLFNDGYTSGCWADPLRYCPYQQNSVAEGCVFFLRMQEGADYQPPEPQGLFPDVPVEAWYAGWVEACHEAGILKLCQTEPEMHACPEAPLDRATVAYMMARAKGLTNP